MKYPFRFYGREPADWHQSPHGYLYDLQFVKAPSAETREKIRALAEKIFGDSPATLGEVWRWGGDGRFLAFAVRERFDDAARMVFTHVAEFLSVVHQQAKLRDVVFCNGVGSRSDRWDSWTLQQAKEPDAGPMRPKAAWASLLRRPEDIASSWEDATPRLPAGVVAAPAPKPVHRSLAAPRQKKGLHVERAAALPPQESDAFVADGWGMIASEFSALSLERILGLKVPAGWVLSGKKKVAVVCLTGAGAPQRVDLPEALQSASSFSVDPDGLHAVVTAGSQIWSINVSDGSLRWRSTIHENNGAISSAAWVVDDLWAIRCTNQLMLFDLSEEDALYVGTQQPTGELVGSFRHGTILVLSAATELYLIGVCDWQCKALGSIPRRGRAPKIINDALYLLSRANPSRGGRVLGVEEAYEAWAAPIRRQAEQDRELRFKSQEKIHWRWIDAKAMPADRHKFRVKALEKRYGEEVLCSVDDSGDAVVGIPREGRTRSRGARFVFCAADNQEKALSSPRIAWEEGITNFSLTSSRDSFFFVSGQYFKVCLVDVSKDVADICAVENFSTRGGLFYDLIARDRDGFLAVWNNSVDWHMRPSGGAVSWRVKATQPLDLPRGNWFDAKGSRLYIMQQSRERLLSFQWTKESLVRDRAWTDPVKEISLREGRFFAQMIDGQWFELMGL